ncbi:MAG: DUF4388 domain-containing protein [Acidobacteriota bacterium]
MTFQGSLRELHLPDVIQLVAVSGKTGAFQLLRGREEGLIYLEAGRIVHATLGDLGGEEAVYALATWDEGSFRFLPGEEPPERTVTKNNTNLLMEAARRMDEWRVLNKKIPSLDHVPRFQVPEGKQGQINLNTQEWLVLSKIDGKTGISQIARRVNLPAFEVAKLLYGLVTMGLIILEEPGLEPAGPSVEDSGLDAVEGGVAVDSDDLRKELHGLIRKLREEAQIAMGEVGWSVILRAYRRAKSELEGGRGTEAVQNMCQEILSQAAHLEGPESQRLLAERFRDVLAEWNAKVS